MWKADRQKDEGLMDDRKRSLESRVILVWKNMILYRVYLNYTINHQNDYA